MINLKFKKRDVHQALKMNILALFDFKFIILN